MNELWTKAESTAVDARMLFAAGRYDSASNRAYYSMFNAARALLIQRGIDVSKISRHATIWSEFSLHFVRDGTFEKPDGRALVKAGEIRHIADYANSSVSGEAAERVMESIKRFLMKAKELLDRTAGERGS